MDDNQNIIKIVKILNLPVECDKTVSLDIDIDINTTYKSTEINLCDDINKNIDRELSKLLNKKILELNRVYRCDELLVEDDKQNKYTIYNFQYVYLSPFLLNIHYDRILYNGHIKNFDGTKFKKIKLTAELKNNHIINKEITVDNIVINIKTQKHNSIHSTMELEILGNKKFSEYQEIIEYLSEYIFLLYEEMFYYDKIILSNDDNEYILNVCNRRKYNRKWSLYSIENKKYTIDEIDKFEEFIKFRKESELIFDLFKTIVYSNSFMEDYPLRLSQLLEGLSNFLKVTDTNKSDTFRSAIKMCIYVSDLKNEFFTTIKDIDDFCKKITKHRNKFSHAIVKSEYLQKDENSEFAKKLYTIIRKLIIKYISGDFN